MQTHSKIELNNNKQDSKEDTAIFDNSRKSLSWGIKGDYSKELMPNEENYLRKIAYHTYDHKDHKIVKFEFYEYHQNNVNLLNNTTYLWIELAWIKWGTDGWEIKKFFHLLREENIVCTSVWLGRFKPTCWIAIQDKEHLTEILQLLIYFEQSITGIKEEIISSVSPYIKPKFRSINWSIEGDSKEFYSSNSINRIKYSCGKKDTILLNVELQRVIENQLPTTNLYFEIFYKEYEVFKNHMNNLEKLIQLYDPIKSAVTRFDERLRVKIKNANDLSDIIQKCLILCPHLSEIHDHILNTYDPEFYKSQKVAFLMGCHSRLGENSSVISSYKQNPIFDKQTIGLLFGFIKQDRPEQKKTPLSCKLEI